MRCGTGRPARTASPSTWPTRPTVAYAQTLDGLLHAFTIERNNIAGSYYDVTAHVPATDGSENMELWSFIPPVALSTIWPNFHANAKISDGGVALADVVPFRSAGEAQTGDGRWKSILVVSSGNSAEGGFYWQQRPDPTQPGTLAAPQRGADMIFGKALPTAAIATVAGLADTDQVAVAILAGGTSLNPPSTSTVARTCVAAGTCPATAHRTTIRDWTNSDACGPSAVVELIIKANDGRLDLRSHQRH